MRKHTVSALTALLFAAAATSSYGQQATARPAPPRPIHVLFLGHVSEHHDAIHLFPLLAGPLSKLGYQLTFVASPEEALRPEMLKYYDEVMIYANHTTITPDQEKALIDFVESGKGLVAIHSASAMFTNSPKYIAMVGGQFQKHGTGDFTAEIVLPEHPVMKGIQPFTTWDETYVHNNHNTVNRTVLMERVDAQGREPYTWVRTQGKGRVFYTAYGHDERTWSNPGFQKLIANAAEWVLSDETRQSRSQALALMPARVNGKPAGDGGQAKAAVDISPIAMTGIAHDEGTMSYDKNSLTVYAGQNVSIVFVNPDVAPHNFLLCEPGSLKAIGAAADKMVRMGTGDDDNYVPKMKEVLFIAPVLEPKKTTKFEFKAPAVPGQYPYICTFPGHWKTMNGVLTVLPPL
ncbi:MAG: ThuA domain-containing protein [Terriglobia bacterium]